MAAHAAGAVTGAGRRWSAYTACGLIGIVAATGVAAAVLHRRGEPAAIALGLLAAGLLGFVVAAKLTELLLRRAALIALHQLVTVTVLPLPIAVLSGVSLPVVLDAVTAGLVALIAIGRVGCQLVGCCHGRPGGWGIRYGPNHVASGFPAHLSWPR